MSNSTYAGGGSLARLALCVFAALAAPLSAAASQAPQEDGLLDLSIAELLHLEVTSASKKSQRLAETAAAVFVITRDDIQRSGARNIPEALRMAPGIEVAQIDANKWSIGARGFNGRFATKLLVLMDGRALYTPSFGGVFWDVQDTLMEDVDRIEVIRGPGGTLWGTNAVNGVINIITRPAAETQGGEVAVALSGEGATTSSFRYGGRVGEQARYRLYAKYLDEDGNQDYAHRATADDTRLGRVGARIEWAPGARDQLSVTTEAYRGASGETLLHPMLVPPYTSIRDAEEKVSGLFATLQWQRRLAEGRELQGHMYFDRTDRDTVLFGERRSTAVVELQYHFPIGARQDLVSGAGYRYNQYHFNESERVSVTPASPTNAGYNAFVQDEIALSPERLALTLGLDLEHNPLSDKSIDALPSGRLMWTLNERNHLWGAVTKAIGTPSYEQTGATVTNISPVIPPGDPRNPFPVPLLSMVVGNPDFRSERLIAYELGYRAQLGATVTVDATLFRQHYDGLWVEKVANYVCEPTQVSVALDPTCLFTATDVAVQLTSRNAMRGNTSGLELAADWAPTERFRFRLAYSQLATSLGSGSSDPDVVEFAAHTQGLSPRHQVHLRGDLSLTHKLDLSVSLRHVDQLPSLAIEQYWSADLNAVWRALPSLEVSISGRNLLHPAHAEFVSEFSDVVPTLIERSIGARVRWTF